jgi:hypothetical protein
MVKLPANLEGRPTEATNAPKAMVGHSANVADGIVRGIPRGTTTKVVDGIVRSACGMMKDSPLDRTVKASATEFATQEFGSGRFAKSAYGSR